MRMVRWVIWHCSPDAGLEIRALVVWGRARYLFVTEALHNIEYLQDSLYLYNLKARVWFEPTISIFPSKQLLITVPGSPPGLDNIPFRWLLVVPHILFISQYKTCCWLLLTIVVKSLLHREFSNLLSYLLLQTEDTNYNFSDCHPPIKKYVVNIYYLKARCKISGHSLKVAHN